MRSITIITPDDESYRRLKDFLLNKGQLTRQEDETYRWRWLSPEEKIQALNALKSKLHIK